jgi:hypothetical protein
MPFELLVEYDVFAGQEVGRRQKIVLTRLNTISLLVKSPFELFEVFAEHILSAEFAPTSKMVDSASLSKPVLFENPVDLLLFAPHDVPIVAISFLPLSIVECPVDAVAKRCLEFDVLAG